MSHFAASAQESVRCWNAAQAGCSGSQPAFGVMNSVEDCCLGTALGMWTDTIGTEVCTPCVGR